MTRFLAALCFSTLFLCSFSPLAAVAQHEMPHVLIETNLGNILVEIDTVAAPITATNFLRYVDAGRYEGTSFYRTVTMDNQPNNDVKIEVIQGGRMGLSEDIENFDAIPHETTDQTGILHKDGVISMARMEPGTASSEIFICVGDQPELDFGGKRNPDGQGFATFGLVVEGMDVVRAIQKQPAEGQRLSPAITIVNITRAE